MGSIDAAKLGQTGRLTYRLSNANVFVSPEGFHFIDYQDPIESVSSEIDEQALTCEIRGYIQNSLQSNPARFANHVSIVENYAGSLSGTRLLDIGCGGGLFLSLVSSRGGIVMGIEPNDARAHYAQSVHGLDVVKTPIEDRYWQSSSSSFDAVTLWDVIEHVNYPENTLRAAVSVLKHGGFLFLDTPCRDAFYHRAGELSYKISGGRYPTFLNSMYSAHPYGHKQIFSTSEIRDMFHSAGLEVINLEKFHELSFPHEFYLERLLRSKALAQIAAPLSKLLLRLIPIKNKMLVVGRKK